MEEGILGNPNTFTSMHFKTNQGCNACGWLCLDGVVLTIDVSNAFNTIRREHILRGCAKRAQAAYNWLQSCYQGHSPLFCQGQLLLKSETGTHQGDRCMWPPGIRPWA